VNDAPASGSPFRHRGVVEGFYGSPLAPDDRLWLVERLGRWGMNVYLHAPKDDPRHRERWREPYPQHEMSAFETLVARGERLGVQVGFAISPGLSIEYASREDRAALASKLACFREIGARWFSLALDDVPSRLVHADDRDAFATLAAAHTALAHELAESLRDEVTLWVVPTDYLGTEATDYLEELGAALDPRIEVGWTGRTVVSPEIRASEAAERAATLKRRLLLWDNVPVSDGPMRPMLHLAPYCGRDPALAEHASGVLLNPMERIRASAPTLYTAARFLADPESYDAEAAWHDALEETGAGAPEAFGLFAAAHRFSPTTPGERDAELEAAIDALDACLREERDPTPALAALDTLLAARAEVEPTLRDGARSQQVLAFFAMQGALSRETLPAQASYGPRRVSYPQLVSMRDDTMGFGADPVLYTDSCLSDKLVTLTERVALERYAS
jgi:hyaluronoglucosaminidase